MRVVLTAGHDKAPHVRLLAEGLRDDGVEIVGVLVVSPFQISRLRNIIRARGLSSLRSLVRKLLGLPGSSASIHLDALQQAMRGQKITNLSLKSWSKMNHVAYRTVKSLNSAEAILFLKGCHPDGVIYGGGGILKQPFIDAANGCVLNAHSGPMPEVRGMNAAEWSILFDLPVTVTVHFIDNGIDTGAPVDRRIVTVDPEDTINLIRSKCVLTGVLLLRENVGALLSGRKETAYDAADHPQCYGLAPLLHALLEERLALARIREKT
jgi:folate-dependent phosphoribosylglycinamide formyltransferase PurN